MRKASSKRKKMMYLDRQREMQAHTHVNEIEQIYYRKIYCIMYLVSYNVSGQCHLKR